MRNFLYTSYVAVGRKANHCSAPPTKNSPARDKAQASGQYIALVHATRQNCILSMWLLAAK